MKNANHTKGPWTIGTYDDNGDLAIVTKHNTVAILDQSIFDDGKHTMSNEVNEANAVLIAAAPEMLEALNLVERVLNSRLNIDDGINEAFDVVQAAIRKAKGETV